MQRVSLLEWLGNAGESEIIFELVLGDSSGGGRGPVTFENVELHR